MLATFIPFSISTQAKILVIAQGSLYSQPFIYENKQRGFTIDLLRKFNNIQDTYHFEPGLVHPRRRWNYFKDGKADIVMFEDPAWDGWKKIKELDSSEHFLRMRDVYIALKQPGRGMDFFSNLKDKHMIGINGYHYGFLNFEVASPNEDNLANLTLLRTESAILSFLLSGRGDCAVVSEYFIKRYLKKHPNINEKILISDISDQEYDLHILVRKDIQITVDYIDEMIESLKKTGEYGGLLNKYGLPNKRAAKNPGTALEELYLF